MNTIGFFFVLEYPAYYPLKGLLNVIMTLIMENLRNETIDGHTTNTVNKDKYDYK